MNYDQQIKIGIQPTRTFELRGNRILNKIDGMDALKQSISLALNTERYQYPIYSAQYGSELSTLIGRKKEYIESETERMIKDALLNDDRITGVENIMFKYENDIVEISFNTIYGELTYEL